MLEQRILHEGLRSFRIIRASSEEEIQAKIQVQMDRWTARYRRVLASQRVQHTRNSGVLSEQEGELIALKIQVELRTDLDLIRTILKTVVDASSSGTLSESLKSWTQQTDQVTGKRIEATVDSEESLSGEEDPMYRDAVSVVLEMGKASMSTLQRRLQLGYGRAARLLDAMQREGIVGPPSGTTPREVLRKPDWFSDTDG